MLAIDANLNLNIDGQKAQLRGSGQKLTLTVENPALLRKFFQVSLPDTRSADDRGLGVSYIPNLLAEQGLTLVIADEKGELLIIGAGAQGKSYKVPLVGELRHVSLASAKAALRLAFNA